MAKTGPKLLVGEALGLKHAERWSYKLLKVIADRTFKVSCIFCDEVRVLTFGKQVDSPKYRCQCQKKRLPYKVSRTPEIHTKEIQKEFEDYKCLKVGKQKGMKFESSATNLYKHSCGYKFSMTWACFRMCVIPCRECRRHLVSRPHRTTKMYRIELRLKSKNIEVLDKYLGTVKPIRHRYKRCGHVVEHRPETILGNKTCGKCPVCYPNRVWFRFKVKGRAFRTRSLIEKAFIKEVIRQGKASVDEIEYEPKLDCVQYKDPSAGTQRKYSPDFRIRDSCIEIKDLHSLGLKPYHWIDQEKALIENRAKHEAASAKLEDYRLYVYIKGKFYRTDKFWTKAEQKRLLSI